MRMTEDDAWKFLEETAEKTMQWEEFNEKSLTPTSKGNIYSIENSIASEAKIVALMRRIEALEVKRTPPQLDHINQLSAPSCFNCTLQLMCWKISRCYQIHSRATKINWMLHFNAKWMIHLPQLTIRGGGIILISRETRGHIKEGPSPTLIRLVVHNFLGPMQANSKILKLL